MSMPKAVSPLGASAAILLGKQLKLMSGQDYIEGISVGLVDDNIFEWEVMLMISDECKWYGGLLHRANLEPIPFQPSC